MLVALLLIYKSTNLKIFCKIFKEELFGYSNSVCPSPHGG